MPLPWRRYPGRQCGSCSGAKMSLICHSSILICWRPHLSYLISGRGNADQNLDRYRFPGLRSGHELPQVECSFGKFIEFSHNALIDLQVGHGAVSRIEPFRIRFLGAFWSEMGGRRKSNVSSGAAGLPFPPGEQQRRWCELV